MKLGRVLLVVACCLALAGAVASACGGGSGSTTGTDSNKVPTATIPATLPSPQIIGAAAFQPGGGAVYVVKSGDSWSAIAVRFGTTLEELLAANAGIDTSQLFPGQSVRLPAIEGTPAPAATEPPVEATEPPATATQADATATQADAATPAPSIAVAGGQTYTVQAGDIPTTIAEKFDITVEALLAANPGLNPTDMHVGDVVNIPPKPSN